MKILFVSKHIPVYEISPFVKDLGESLKKLNEVSLDYFTFNNRGWVGYLKNLLALRKILKDRHYDIIHSHYGLTAFLTILQKKIPVIATFHGSDINIPMINILSSTACLFSKRCIFVSPKLYDQIYIKPSKRYSVIPCGVNFDLFKPMDKTESRNVLGLDSTKKYVLFSSYFDRTIKNYPLAKRAVTYLNNGDIELIELKGYSHEEVSLLMNVCDVALLTSLSEGSPQFVKEAMACNCPIVSTDVGDVRKVIGDTEGCYITTFEPEDVAEKIKLALDFSEKKGRTRGRDRIIQLGLDSESVAKRIISVYERVLSRG